MRRLLRHKEKTQRLPLYGKWPTLEEVCTLMSHQVSVARRLDDSPQISDAFHQTPHTSDSQAGQVSLASSVQLSTGVTCLVSELGWVVQFLRLLEQTCSTGVLLPHLYPASYITEHPFLRPSSESKENKQESNLSFHHSGPGG